jgi:VanZ family protein
LFEYLEKRKLYLVYVPLVVYWIVLFTATSLPASNLPSVDVSDKIKHFSAFFGLSVLLSLTLLYQGKVLLFKKYFLAAALVICSIYGLLDEFHQSFVPGRNSEFLDWVADFLGAAAGVLLVYYLLKKYKYFPKPVNRFRDEFLS